MFAVVEDWKASGLSQKAFSALHEINIATLGYWVAKFKESAFATNGFVELREGCSNKEYQIEVIYPTGVRLKVDRDLALIAQLIRL